MFARCLSSLKSDRVIASKMLQGPSEPAFKGDKKQFIEDVRQVITRLISCVQIFIDVIKVCVDKLRFVNTR